MSDRIKSSPGLKIAMNKQPQVWFRNHYHCNECLHEWTDDWDTTCDDDCPLCGNRACSPVFSEDLDDNGNVVEHAPIKLRLTLDVIYNPKGMTPLELSAMLKTGVGILMSNGQVTGDGPAEVDEYHYTVDEIADTWGDDLIQFPRLIAELEAAGGFTPEVMEDLCNSMDLYPFNVAELINRAQDTWDKIKEKSSPVA